MDSQGDGQARRSHAAWFVIPLAVLVVILGSVGGYRYLAYRRQAARQPAPAAPPAALLGQVESTTVAAQPARDPFQPPSGFEPPPPAAPAQPAAAQVAPAPVAVPGPMPMPPAVPRNDNPAPAVVPALPTL
ncbi:MAG: hypothetical protein HYU66_24320, partial [Armatimonadetes bacterium]|nr:hypothetical protein [Armatimonadota bacterium]